MKIMDVEGLTPAESPMDRDFYQTQYELLQSRSLARRVVQDLRAGPRRRCSPKQMAEGRRRLRRPARQRPPPCARPANARWSKRCSSR